MVEGRGGDAVDPAPMRRSIRQRSTISGSRAAFSITVVPRARTAAVSRFSVAPDAREVQPHVRADEALRRLRDEEAVVDVDDGAQLLQAGDVHVEAAGADRVAPGQGDVRRAAPRDERTEHADRGAHGADQVVVRPVQRHGRDADGDDAGGRVVLDVAARGGGAARP